MTPKSLYPALRTFVDDPELRLKSQAITGVLGTWALFVPSGPGYPFRHVLESSGCRLCRNTADRTPKRPKPLEFPCWSNWANLGRASATPLCCYNNCDFVHPRRRASRPFTTLSDCWQGTATSPTRGWHLHISERCLSYCICHMPAPVNGSAATAMLHVQACLSSVAGPSCKGQLYP